MQKAASEVEDLAQWPIIRRVEPVGRGDGVTATSASPGPHPTVMAFFRFQLLRDVYSLVRPFGRRRLAGIVGFNIVQAGFQALSVIAIMLFTMAATNTSENARVPGLSAVLDQVYPEATARDLIVIMSGLTVFVIVVSNLLNIVGEYLRSRYTTKTGYLLTTGILRTIAVRPYSFHLRNNSSLLTKKANGDVAAFVSGVLAPLLDLMARVLVASFTFGAMVLAEPVLALVLSALFLVFYYLVYLGARRFWKLLNQQFNVLAQIAFKSIYQFLTGIKPIIVHDVRRHFLETYETAAAKHVRYKALSPVVANGPRYIVEILVFGGGIAIFASLILGGAQIEDLAPVAVTFMYGGYKLLPNFQLMFGTLGSIRTHEYTIYEILADFSPKDLHRVHGPLPEPQREALDFRDRISVENVSFRYTDDSRLVLKDLTLEIRRGQKVAFVGQTGSGKSTLVDMILGLHIPVSGRIAVDGTTLDPTTIAAWRRRIGYVPQDIFLVDESVRKNIAFGIKDSEIDEEAVKEAIRMAQAEEFVYHRLPEGLDTVVGERGVRLSGGQRQRIGLARALYHRPDVLILDEATSALDNATEAAIMRVIDDLSSHLTILMIAHRLTTVVHADRIFMLTQGEISAVGSYDELIRQSDEFRSLAEVAR